MSNRVFGGWSQNLTQLPLPSFNVMMYGMVTNLTQLTTGTAEHPGWSPKNSAKPTFPSYQGKTLWTYGGGGCFPVEHPNSNIEVDKIVATTIDKGWDGVDFDDECNMNIHQVIQAMSNLKNAEKDTSYGFIAGWNYNHPETKAGKELTQKVQEVISCGFCDRLIHYCYAAAMWSEDVIQANVRPSLERSLLYGMPKEKIMLALTTKGLNEKNLNYFLDQIINLQLGGLFVWNYPKLTEPQIQLIREKLELPTE